MVVGGLGLEKPRAKVITGICSAGSSWEKNEGENVREREGGCSVQTPFVSSKTLRNRVYAAQVIYIKVVVLRSLYLFQSGYLDQKCKFPEI